MSGCTLSQHSYETTPADFEKLSSDELRRYAQTEQKLFSENRDHRRMAAIQLLGSGHSAAVKAVAHRLKNADDPEVREDMIRAIGFCRDHRCFDLLLQTLDDPNDNVKKAAASALGYFHRPEEIRAMIEITSDDSIPSRIKELLFNAFGEGIFVKTTPVLINGLRDERPEVRTAALTALQKIWDRDIPLDIAAWNKVWQSNRYRDREDILAERLYSLRSQLDNARDEASALKAELEELSALAMSAKPQGSDRLLEALLSRHRIIREFAAHQLALLSEDELKNVSLDRYETYEIFRKSLLRDNDRLKSDIVTVIRKLRGQYRDDLLIQAMDSTNPDVLTNVIKSIDKNWGVRVMKKLEDALQSQHTDVREAAANALGKIASPDAIPILRGALNDKAENVRWFAVEGLRKLNAVEAVPQLCNLATTGQSPLVREIVVKTLGEMGQPAAIPALRDALEDDNQRVQESAVSALKELGKINAERATVVSDILTKAGYPDDAIEVLRSLLEDNEDAATDQEMEIRKKIANILQSEGKWEKAAEELLKIDRSRGGDTSIRNDILESWIKAEKPGRVLESMKIWLENPGNPGLNEMIQMGIKFARQMKDKNKLEAMELLDMLGARAKEINATDLLKAIEAEKTTAP
jgi:HEAT repeat protein